MERVHFVSGATALLVGAGAGVAAVYRRPSLVCGGFAVTLRARLSGAPASESMRLSPRRMATPTRRRRSRNAALPFRSICVWRPSLSNGRLPPDRDDHLALCFASLKYKQAHAAENRARTMFGPDTFWNWAQLSGAARLQLISSAPMWRGKKCRRH